MSVNLQELHEELLVLMTRFHQICVENGIQYSLHAGTLLGAVREKGFIPWDDDVDLTLTRTEFEKLKKVLQNGDFGPEIAYDETSRYPRFVMKREGKPVVWADIFIYDYISQNKYARKLKLMIIYFFVLFCRTKEDQRLSNIHGLYHGPKKWVMNFIVALGNLFPLPFRLKLATWSMQLFPGKRTHIHRSNDQYRAIKLTLPKEVMDSYENIDFLGQQLMVSTRWHDILVNAYGESYMTPRKDKPEEMHALAFETEQKFFIDTYFSK